MSGKGLKVFAAGVALITGVAGSAASGVASNTDTPGGGSELRGESRPYPQLIAEGTGDWHFFVSPGSEGEMTVQVSKGSRRDVYFTAAGTATTETFQADFEGFGAIDMDFKPKGKKKKLELPRKCEGKPEKLQKGVWKGSFQFNADVSQVDLSKAPGRIYYPGDLLCPIHPISNGVYLSASTPNEQFNATKAKNGKEKPYFSAQRSYQEGSVSVSEYVYAQGPKSSFVYDLGDDTASVTPPGAFYGEGTYDQGSWSGDLGVNFPRSSTFDLISGFEARLSDGD